MRAPYAARARARRAARPLPVPPRPRPQGRPAVAGTRAVARTPRARARRARPAVAGTRAAARTPAPAPAGRPDARVSDGRARPRTASRCGRPLRLRTPSGRSAPPGRAPLRPPAPWTSSGRLAASAGPRTACRPRRRHWPGRASPGQPGTRAARRLPPRRGLRSARQARGAPHDLPPGRALRSAGRTRAAHAPRMPTDPATGPGSGRQCVGAPGAAQIRREPRGRGGAEGGRREGRPRPAGPRPAAGPVRRPADRSGCSAPPGPDRPASCRPPRPTAPGPAPAAPRR